jgi:hypothetical protein
MPVNSREELVGYCLRRLGAPVISINVDSEQVEDRIDEALQYYIQYHYDGTEREIVRVVIDEQMAAAKAIKVDPSVVSILRVVPDITAFESLMAGSPSYRGQDGLISMNYYNGVETGGFSMRSFASYSVQSDVLKMLFRPEQMITFRHANNTVTFDTTRAMTVGEKFFLEVYRGVDPSTSTTVWNDMWLKEMATCLINLQWGQNLIKYSGVQLPTGITLDGRAIFADATAERERLLERLREEFSYPADFFMC